MNPSYLRGENENKDYSQGDNQSRKGITNGGEVSRPPERLPIQLQRLFKRIDPEGY